MPPSSPLELWRISAHPSLDGIGAFRLGGRWNTPGRHVVYLAETTARAMLETLPHLSLDGADLPDRFRLMRVTVPAVLEVTPITTLPTHLVATRKAGDAWLRGQATPLARVPSVIVPYSWNYLLNPKHPDATKVKVVETSQHLYDPRLLRFRGA